MSGDSPRDLRIASSVRAIFIGALLFGYGYFLHQPTVSFIASFLIAAALQIAVVVARMLVPRDAMPTTQFVLEMVADGATVFLFALGVYGGILRTATDV